LSQAACDFPEARLDIVWHRFAIAAAIGVAFLQVGLVPVTGRLTLSYVTTGSILRSDSLPAMQ
jgi:hypothetical protein